MNKRTLEQLQVEIDAAYLYGKLATVQKDPALANVLKQLSAIEESHAQHAIDKIRKSAPSFQPPGASRRARIQFKLGKIFGYDFIIANLSSMERSLASSTVRGKVKHGQKPSGLEHNHVMIIEAVSRGTTPASGGFIARMEGRHKTVGGNALRAAVLGANDGLVSNMSLVMGVTGAAASNTTILITGIAGMLAGAISMSLGEWLSVQSSRELNQRQIDLEAEELESSPEQERQELSLLYQAKGMDAESADALSHKVFENKEGALDTLVREELGIDQQELGGSAWEAAFASFFLFVAGAIIPVLPFTFLSGTQAVYTCLAFSVVGLFVIGASITLFTGRSFVTSGLRQVLFGLAAAAVTYGIGKLIDVSLIH